MLRVLATPRWVGWTLLAVVVVATCGGMAYWQLTRAESPTGSLLNAGYAFQWPLFGVFFAVLWWRMLRQEAEVLAEVEAHGPDDDATSPPREELLGPSPFTARPVGVRPGDADDPPRPGSARAEYNAMLTALAGAETESAAEADGPGDDEHPGTDHHEEHARP